MLKRHGLENPRKSSLYLPWITLKIQTIYKNKVAIRLSLVPGIHSTHVTLGLIHVCWQTKRISGAWVPSQCWTNPCAHVVPGGWAPQRTRGFWSALEMNHACASLRNT
jgi:hypothetical protein